MLDFEVSFEDSDKPPVHLSLGANLAEKLNAKNSPLLFGCRMGICGTCLVEVLAGAESLAPPDETEREYLESFAPPGKTCRLACQINLSADIRVRHIRDK